MNHLEIAIRNILNIAPDTTLLDGIRDAASEIERLTKEVAALTEQLRCEKLEHEYYKRDAAASQSILDETRAALKTPNGAGITGHAKILVNEVEYLRHEVGFLRQVREAQRTSITNLMSERNQLRHDLEFFKHARDYLRAELDKAQKNASGNAVLVRKDGFSKPVTLETYSQHADCVERVGDSLCYRIRRFTTEGKRDGFGRTIYAESIL